MAIKTFTTGEVLTASDTNTYLANSGLVYVNQFTATSGTGLIMDSIFSSTYSAYRVVVESFQVTTSLTGLSCQLRTGGTTITSTGYYGIRVGYAYNTNLAGSSNQNNGINWDLPIICNSATGFGAGSFDVFNPQIATRTSFSGSGTDTRVDGYGALIGSGFYNANTQCDGLYLFSGQTISNLKVTVYGYRKGN